LCALASPEAALDLFNRFQQHDAAAIQAYEYMSRAGIDLVLRYIPGTALPIATAAEQYALIELATPREGAGLRASLEEVLAAATAISIYLVQPEDADPVAFLARDHELMDAVNEIVRALDGSFSAEHGIGKLKPYMMPEWRGGAELELMRRIKAALDPKGLLNPGKLLP